MIIVTIKEPINPAVCHLVLLFMQLKKLEKLYPTSVWRLDISYSHDCHICSYYNKYVSRLGSSYIYMFNESTGWIGVQMRSPPYRKPMAVSPYASLSYSKNLTWYTGWWFFPTHLNNINQIGSFPWYTYYDPFFCEIDPNLQFVPCTSNQPRNAVETSQIAVSNDQRRVLCICWSSTVRVEHRTHTERCFHCAWQEWYPSDCDTSMTGLWPV